MRLPARPTPSAMPRSLFFLPPPPPPLVAELGVDVAGAAVTVTPVDRGAVPVVDPIRLEVLVVRVLEVLLVVVVFLDVGVVEVDVEAKARVAVLLRANPEVPSEQQPEPQQEQ